VVSPDAVSPAEASLREANRRFYDPMWTDVRLVGPERFNTWPLVSELAAQSGRRLEVGPGLRPRLPIEGTCFVDMSAPAVGKLRASGAHALLGFVSALPFANRTFGLVCALDIVEHVDDEDAALSELARVAAPGAALLLSVPLHPAQWTPFDDFVGHRRRYEPDRLVAKLAEHEARLLAAARHRDVVADPPARAGDVVVRARVHAARRPVPEEAAARSGGDRDRRGGRNSRRVSAARQVAGRMH
jgi:SAM-dependent methyltransferase